MKERTALKWTSRISLAAATAIGAYWSGLWTFGPWNPNWKLWALFTLVHVLAAGGGHSRGWLKGYDHAKTATSAEG